MADRPFQRLGDVLDSHREDLERKLDRLEAIERSRKGSSPAPARVPMTQEQLMRLAFELVGHEPELEIDWDRVEIVDAAPIARAELVEPTPPAAPEPRPPRMPSSTTPDLAAKAWQGNGWRDEGVHLEPPSPLHADEVRRLAADAAQVPRLRLRGLERHAARRQLRDFVVLARHADIRVIRIVTGKGLGSQGAPVLRPLVGRWLETAQRDGSVRGWHYEVDASGAWGSVLVALRRWKCESL